MGNRTAAVVAVVALLAGRATAQDKVANVAVGELVTLAMTGELAVEYGRRVGFLAADAAPGGFFVETTATISQELPYGYFRIEHSTPVLNSEKSPRLVTLTAFIDAKQIAVHITPAGTSVWSSPSDPKRGILPTQTEEDTRQAEIKLSDLKGVKLRTWNLAEEVGGVTPGTPRPTRGPESRTGQPELKGSQGKSSGNQEEPSPPIRREPGGRS